MTSGRLFALLLWAVFAVLLRPAEAQPRGDGRSESRLALVIGNAAYPNADAPLTQPVNDARALADELRRLGFQVELGENLSKETMQKAVADLRRRVAPGSAVLLFFSGYGIQVSRQTFVIPVDAEIWREPDVLRNGVSVEAVLAELNSAGARVKIVVLDASRRNPFERRFRSAFAGLAPINIPDGTLAMYATAPGKVVVDDRGPNSLFASELLKEIRTPGISAEDVFSRVRFAVSRASRGEQVPWMSSSLVEDFYFIEAAASRPPAAPAPPAAPRAPAPEPARAEIKPGDIFRDCRDCPEMVALRGGEFEMGSAEFPFEKPQHKVTIKPFAIGRHEVRFAEWDLCVAEGGCKHRPDDRGRGRGVRPVTDVSWSDAQQFVAWLSRKTGHRYRLPSEAEWEYAARGGTTSAFWWGDKPDSGRANCQGCGGSSERRALPTASFPPNPFGLFDTSGNAAEWVEDCWNDSYRGAPKDGSAWTSGQCQYRVLRGGSFDNPVRYVRSAARFRYDADVRYYANGFRVARDLP